MSGDNGQKKCWMVRAGEGGILFDKFREGGFAAIGWRAVGDLSKKNDREEILKVVEDCYPDYSRQQSGGLAGTLHTFTSVMSEGDTVVTYNKDTREYLLGNIVGGYEFKVGEEMPHRREVKWVGNAVPRDDLPDDAKNTLGGGTAVFSINDEVAQKLLKVRDQGETQRPESPPPEASDPAGESGKARAEQALERVMDQIMRLGPYEMQDLVAAVLRAMGYKTKVAKEGAHGMDVIASSNLLVWGGRRIVAEVKHRKGTIGVEDLREFRGAMSDEDRGLFVSTGGFKVTSAEMHARPLVELVDLEGLARLVIDNYDNFDPEGRALLPLVKMYWPA